MSKDTALFGIQLAGDGKLSRSVVTRVTKSIPSESYYLYNAFTGLLSSSVNPKHLDGIEDSIWRRNFG